MAVDDYRPLEASDLPEACEILSRAFTAGEDPARSAAWIDRLGRENLRVHGRPASGVLGLVLMGQWFGGRSVPTAGIAGVGVDPVQRGRGVAHEMMLAMLHEVHERGVPISTLYPSTYTLYRSVGYERAGSRFRATVPTESAPAGRTDAELVPLTEAHRPAVRELYRGLAARRDGHLDRGPYVWHRIEHPHEQRVHAYAVAGDPLRGYASWVQARCDEGHYRLEILDVQAGDAEAARALLGLFAAHRSLARKVTWPSAPNDPLLALLPERFYELTLVDQWMLRIVDVPGALEARGWPAGLEVELALRVRDASLPWNDGAFVLHVSGTEARVERGGAGTLEVTERGLAALYSGHLSPWALRACGQLEGPEPALAAASAAFGGPGPWMPDMF